MADEADIAAGAANKFLDHSLAHRKPDGPACTGQCLNCGDPLPEDRRWCDADCRDDWERAQR